MHNDLVSYVQSNYAADGIEVRAVGPKAIKLALPPELHDLGNLCGELEMRYNARMDIEAGEAAGVGPTATVWVQTESEKEEVRRALSEDEDDLKKTAEEASKTPEADATKTKSWIGLCTAGAVVAAFTFVAAAVSIVSNGTRLWKQFSDEL